jgi:hypothetical protein
MLDHLVDQIVRCDLTRFLTGDATVDLHRSA